MAEHTSLIKACEWAKKTENKHIHIEQDCFLGNMWLWDALKQSRFLLSAGTLIKNGQVKELSDSFLLSRDVAIVKVEAHVKRDNRNNKIL